MARRRSYNPKVLVGNWTEEQQLLEDAKNEFEQKKNRGELTSQRDDFLKRLILTPASLSVSSDGRLHFGDSVMLVNAGGENRKCSAVAVNADIGALLTTPAPRIRSPCGVSAASRLAPTARNAFTICSVDGSPEGSVLRFEQSFALTTTATSVAKGLYLTSDLISFLKCAKMSRLQEVSLVDEPSFLSWWKLVHFDPQERLEHWGLPVPANSKVLLIHCKTNQALAVLGDHALWTTYGQEYEVSVHTFLDSHKAERDPNHWLLCTAFRPGAGLLILNQQGAAAGEELPPEGAELPPEGEELHPEGEELNKFKNTQPSNEASNATKQ